MGYQGNRTKNYIFNKINELWPSIEKHGRVYNSLIQKNLKN